MGLHASIINSEFKDRYLEIKKRLPKVKHLLHGGVENYYAGLDFESLRYSLGMRGVNRKSMIRTMSNLEIGLEGINKSDVADEEIYIDCCPRPTQDKKMREAIWQYNIFVEYEPVATIGMNFHHEYSAIVATIPNIQGLDKKGVEKLRQICDNIPWPVRALSLIIPILPKDIKIIRGIASGKHPFLCSKGFDKHRASNLYDRTFKKLGMTAIRDDDKKVKYYEMVR